MPAVSLAKPNSRAGFTFLPAAFARALIAGKALQLGNLDGSGCFHSLPLSLPGSFIHASSLFSPVHFSLTLSFMLARSFSFSWLYF